MTKTLWELALAMFIVGVLILLLAGIRHKECLMIVQPWLYAGRC